jgi:hypothetical protein
VNTAMLSFSSGSLRYRYAPAKKNDAAVIAKSRRGRDLAAAILK